MPKTKNRPDRLQFVLSGGRKLTASIRRSARARHARLRVSPHGELALIVPAGMSYEDVAGLAPHFLPWLEKVWQEGKFLPARPQLPEFISLPLLKLNLHLNRLADWGACMSAKAQRRMLVNVDMRRRLIMVDGDALVICGADDDARVDVLALKAFLRQLAGDYLPGRLAGLAKEGGMGPIKCIVRDQRSRWGSCSHKEGTAKITVSLNWRAILLPLDLLDHLCWHELSHIGQMNHSPEFYAELARHSPDFRRKEKALDVFWRDLPLWAVPEC